MDIHRPKAAHSVREFVIEIGTIICGILIALGLEQAVETLHWSHKVEAAREALREELSSAAYSAQERLALKGCLESRLDKLEASLATSGNYWAGQPWTRYAGSLLNEGAAYGAPIRNWDTGVWRSLVADGTAAHFPRDEMLRLTAVYQFIDNVREQNGHERAQLAPVAALGRSFSLSQTARDTIRVAVEEQREMNRLAALGGAQIADSIRRAEMGPASPLWLKRIKGLQRYAEDCDAGRPTRFNSDGYPADQA